MTIVIKPITIVTIAMRTILNTTENTSFVASITSAIIVGLTSMEFPAIK